MTELVDNSVQWVAYSLHLMLLCTLLLAATMLLVAVTRRPLLQMCEAAGVVASAVGLVVTLTVSS